MVKAKNTGIMLVEKNGHHYYKKTKDKELYPSVTTVLDAVLAKPALVPWAKRVALESCKRQFLEHPWDGDFPNEQYWAEYVESVIEIAAKEPDRQRDVAADIGTRAHDVIHKLLAGKPYKITDDIKPCIDGFLEWYDQNKLKIIYSEIRVASDAIKVGGTVDFVAERKGGGLVLGDWKSSKGIYDSFGYQVGGYKICFEETLSKIVDELWIVRFPKTLEDQPFEARKVRDIEHAASGFALINAVYRSMKEKMYE